MDDIKLCIPLPKNIYLEHSFIFEIKEYKFLYMGPTDKLKVDAVISFPKLDNWI